MSNVVSLQAARDTAREAAAAHPNQAKVEALTKRIVELKLELRRNDRSAGQKSAASAELQKLEVERSKLQAEQRATVAEAQALLSRGRRAAREADVQALAQKLRVLPLKELEERRAKLTEERRALKLELRAVVAVLGERDAELRIQELVSTMSDAEKAALFQRLQADGVPSAEAVGVPGRS